METDAVGQSTACILVEEPVNDIPKPALWDRARVKVAGRREPGEGRVRFQLRRRLEPIVRVQRAECGADERAEVAKELRGRIEYWGRDVVPDDRRMWRAAGRTYVRYVAVMLVLGYVLSILRTLAGAVGVLAGLALAVYAAWRYFRPAFRRAPVWLSERVCCDCGYELTSNTDGVDPALIGGVRVGPAKCPECGAAWPLVPPAVPE